MALKKQMELFEDGGLMDEGGMIDEQSGNEVPPGSMREEVRDDIPAQLSEGEFVFPADVVRYHGLDKLMDMRQEAKAGLARMEAMGQMGNADEATLPDNIPFDIDDLDIEEDEREYQIGGFVPPAGVQTSSMTGIQTVQPSQFTGYQPQYAAYQPPTPLPGVQQYIPPTQAFVPAQPQVSFAPTQYATYVDDLGNMMQIPVDAEGNPMQPIPPGYYKQGEKPTPEVEVPEAEPITQQPTTTIAPTGEGPDKEFEAQPFGGTEFALSNKNLRAATMDLAKNQLISIHPTSSIAGAIKKEIKGTPTANDIAVAGNQARLGALQAMGLSNMSEVSSDAQAAFIGDVMGAAMTAAKEDMNIVDAYDKFTKENELNKYSGDTGVAAQTPEAEATRARIIDIATKSLQGKSTTPTTAVETAKVETTLTQPEQASVSEVADVTRESVIDAFMSGFSPEGDMFSGPRATEDDVSRLGIDPLSASSRVGTRLSPVEQGMIAESKFAEFFDKHQGDIDSMMKDKTSPYSADDIISSFTAAERAKVKEDIAEVVDESTAPTPTKAPRDPIADAKEIREEKQKDPNYNPYSDKETAFTSNTGTTFNASGIGIKSSTGKDLQAPGSGTTFASGYLSTDETGKVTGAAIPGSKEYKDKKAKEQSGDDGGNAKSIICTQMYNMAGFGSYRSTLWRTHADVYYSNQRLVNGYHKILRPFVNKMPTNKFVYLVLSYFARNRTVYIRNQMRNKENTLTSKLVWGTIHGMLYGVGYLIEKGFIKKEKP